MTNGRILYCGESTGFAGGIERFAYKTALCLRQNGWQVDWCGQQAGRSESLFRNGFDKVQTVEEVLEGDTFYDLAVLHKIPSLPVLKRLRERFGEKLVFLAHDHDLYCPRSYYYTPFGRTNCHRACSPLRCWLCSRLISPRRWGGLRQNYMALLRELRGHHAAVLSAFMKHNLLLNGFREERIHSLPPVIEVPESINRAGESKVLRILYLGQLIRGKGVDLMLQALRLVSRPWQATIVGDGNDKPMLETLAVALGIADRIQFTGWLDDPESCFTDCDVVVFPSRWQEPFGLSGAEALAHGVPVVAFDTGGVREWLDDGHGGFVVPEKDLQAMADKLDTLASDSALRREMGENGRRLIRERFAPECFLTAINRLAEAVNSPEDKR